jgi:hypothetical protein
LSGALDKKKRADRELQPAQEMQKSFCQVLTKSRRLIHTISGAVHPRPWQFTLEEDCKVFYPKEDLAGLGRGF